MADYSSHEEYLSMWLAKSEEVPRHLLSEFGTRRLFDMLKRAGTNLPPRSIIEQVQVFSSLSVNSRPYDPDFCHVPAGSKCVRCMRVHPGTEADCHSRNKASLFALSLLWRRSYIRFFQVCRTCGQIGHFSGIHGVTDPAFRQAIIDSLGEEIFGENHGAKKRLAEDDDVVVTATAAAPSEKAAPSAKSAKVSGANLEPLTLLAERRPSARQMDDWYH